MLKRYYFKQDGKLVTIFIDQLPQTPEAPWYLYGCLLFIAPGDTDRLTWVDSNFGQRKPQQLSQPNNLKHKHLKMPES